MPPIKISYIVATPELELHEQVKAYQGDMKVAFRQLADLGYDGVELMVRDPDKVDYRRIQRLSDQYGLEVPAINTGEVYPQDGLSFMAPDEMDRKEALSRTKKMIDLAKILGARVTIGKLRGQLTDLIPRDTLLGWKDAILSECIDYAAKQKVTLALEPITHLFCNHINSMQEGLEEVERFGTETLGLMADLFHMNLEERSFSAGFDLARPYLTHIHVCDSNKLAPGRGNFVFKEIIKIIKDSGYRGYLSAEISQFPTAAIAMAETIGVIRPLL